MEVICLVDVILRGFLILLRVVAGQNMSGGWPKASALHPPLPMLDRRQRNGYELVV